MKRIAYGLFLFLISCTMPKEKKVDAILEPTDTAAIVQTDSSSANQADKTLPLPEPKKIRNPKGIYQTELPGKMEQTISFGNDYTFRLQERYTREHKDSTVIVTGNWSPSDGFIWLYHAQVVRGRYKWDGDTLQYYNPTTRKSFSMKALNDVMQNQVWQDKKKQGSILFGIGTEPFWSVDYVKDSLSFSRQDGSSPLKLAVSKVIKSPDSTSILANRDSIELRVTVYPYFCNDGMSDNVYRNKLTIQYNNETFHGCGILFRQMP